MLFFSILNQIWFNTLRSREMSLTHETKTNLSLIYLYILRVKAKVENYVAFLFYMIIDVSLFYYLLRKNTRKVNRNERWETHHLHFDKCQLFQLTLERYVLSVTRTNFYVFVVYVYDYILRIVVNLLCQLKLVSCNNIHFNILFLRIDKIFYIIKFYIQRKDNIESKGFE